MFGQKPEIITVATLSTMCDGLGIGFKSSSTEIKEHTIPNNSDSNNIESIQMSSIDIPESITSNEESVHLTQFDNINKPRFNPDDILWL